MSESPCIEEKAMDLLSQLECILESEPLIDEVGFVHPSQFVILSKEADDCHTSSEHRILKSEMSDVDSLENNTNFWSRDHKLGISTQVLLPLYGAAKHAFMAAIRQYRTSNYLSDKHGVENISSGTPSFDPIEREVMKHSRALLLLSYDFGTAWNIRKLVVSKKQQLSMFMDELLLSDLILSYSPKSEQAWSHRRWVIKMLAGKRSTLQDIIAKESELVEKIAERSKMNYRAWNHRCWLVSYMEREQVLHELKKSRDWSGLHVADNSCFHYRRKLMLRFLENFHKQAHESRSSNMENYQVLKEELNWNEMLIKRYKGREALWLHRRFLSLCWIRQLATNLHSVSFHSEQKESRDTEIDIFIDNELCLLNSCSTIQDSEFEDFEAQAMHSSTYMLWLAKQIPESQGIELQAKLKAGNLKTLLNKTCPQRSSLWNRLLD